jgi:hypothetical protein
MANFEFLEKHVTTRMAPVAAHAAHLLHLTRPPALRPFLEERHAMSAATAQRLAGEVAPFIEQALAFHEASASASMRIRPVLQYYSYLNFAVAVVLIYQPDNWQSYRSHGAEDLTHGLQRISLASPVVRVRSGALSLFHSLLAEGPLPKSKLTLKHLLVSIPMVAAELHHVAGLSPTTIHVRDHLRNEGEPDKQVVRSCFTFSAAAGRNEPPPKAFPIKRLYSVMPRLREQYSCEPRDNGSSRTFVSKRTWTLSNRPRAERFHNDTKLKVSNFGGHMVDANCVSHYSWPVNPGLPIIPTMSAALLLSFTLSSLCRYRANILDRVESSRVNLLCEVFANEADGFIIPTMRNLLHADHLCVHSAPYT